MKSKKNRKIQVKKSNLRSQSAKKTKNEEPVKKSNLSQKISKAKKKILESKKALGKKKETTINESKKTLGKKKETTINKSNLKKNEPKIEKKVKISDKHVNKGKSQINTKILKDNKSKKKEETKKEEEKKMVKAIKKG